MVRHIFIYIHIMDHSISTCCYMSEVCLMHFDFCHRSQQTGLPVSVRVRVKDKMFNLHKVSLTELESNNISHS